MEPCDWPRPSINCPIAVELGALASVSARQHGGSTHAAAGRRELGEGSRLQSASLSPTGGLRPGRGKQEGRREDASGGRASRGRGRDLSDGPRPVLGRGPGGLSCGEHGEDVVACSGEGTRRPVLGGGMVACPGGGGMVACSGEGIWRSVLGRGDPVACPVEDLVACPGETRRYVLRGSGGLFWGGGLKMPG